VSESGLRRKTKNVFPRVNLSSSFRVFPEGAFSNDRESEFASSAGKKASLFFSAPLPDFGTREREREREQHLKVKELGEGRRERRAKIGLEAEEADQVETVDGKEVSRGES